MLALVLSCFRWQWWLWTVLVGVWALCRLVVLHE